MYLSWYDIHVCHVKHAKSSFLGKGKVLKLDDKSLAKYTSLVHQIS
jgi:hypothetical protein